MRRYVFVFIILIAFLLLSSITSAQFKFVPLDIISNFFNSILRSLGLITTATSQNPIPSSGTIVYGPSKMIVGVDYYWQTDEFDFTKKDLPLLKTAGIQMLRLSFNGDSVPNLRKLVPAVVNNNEYKLQVLGLLVRTDLLERTDLDLTQKLNAWGDWVNDTVYRFKSNVTVWEIWNEPSWNYGFGSPGDPVKYMYFLKRAYDKVKNACPECKVLGGSVLATGQYGLTFLSGIYKNGANDSMDALAFHPYCYPKPPQEPYQTDDEKAFWKLETEVRPIMANYGDGDKKIWITEMGWATNDPGGEGVSEDEQAKYLVKALEMARDWGWVETFIIYKWKDSELQGRLTKGLLHTDRTPKPSFYAVKDFISSA
jgi:hypothetical protein